MSTNLRRCLLLLLTALFGFASPARAQDVPLTSWAQLASRTDRLETEVEYLACRACPEPGWRFELDSIVWQLEKRSTDFAIATDNTALAVGRGQIQHNDFGWDLGGRLRAGYNTASGWNFGFGYTYFQTDATDTAVEPANGNLWATRTHPDRNEQAATAVASDDFELNLFDLETRYAFAANEWLGIELFSGLRWANMDSDLQILYDGRDFVNGVVSNSHEMTAFGARVGGEFHWTVTDCWSLYGGASGSVLYGRFDRRHLETDNNGADTIVDVQESYGRPVTVLETSVGIARRWSDRVEFRSGYELASWMGMADRSMFVDDVHEGLYAPLSDDILLHGGFFRVTITR